jgi:hypothetical protein
MMKRWRQGALAQQITNSLVDFECWPLTQTKKINDASAKHRRGGRPGSHVFSVFVGAGRKICVC